MAYEKTNWKDRNVEFPNRFTLQDNGDGTYTLVPSPGAVTEVGTPLSAANLNKLEMQYDESKADIDAHANRTDNPHGVTTDLIGAVKYKDILMPTNNFGGKNLYINLINNALFRAVERWNVSGNIYNADGSLYAASSITDLRRLFDGNYDSYLSIPAGKKLVVAINFNGGTFPGYPYGKLMISHYHTYFSQSAKLRVYTTYEPHVIGWHEFDFVDLVRGSDNLIQYAQNTKYAISDMEFVVTAPAASNAYLSHIDFSLDRPGTNPMPFVSKYNPEVLYSNLSFKNGATIDIEGNTVWHTGNDGAGSGLDADTLDGKHASDISGQRVSSVKTTKFSTTSTALVSSNKVTVTVDKPSILTIIHGGRTEISSNAGSFRYAYARLHVNGAQQGYEHYSESGSGSGYYNATWSEVVSVAAGTHTIEVMLRTSNADRAASYLGTLAVVVTAA